MKLIQDLRDILIRDINTRTLLASIESGVEKDGKKRGTGRFFCFLSEIFPRRFNCGEKIAEKGKAPRVVY